MISAVNQEDLNEIQSLISKSILTCIDVSESVAEDLISDTLQESEFWLNNQENGVHLVYRENDTILGVILIKEYWNMTGLFVCPSVQNSGVASKLVSHALSLCREHSPINAVRLNSSSYASGFYAKFGFKRNGASKDLPGGCIPYAYSF